VSCSRVIEWVAAVAVVVAGLVVGGALHASVLVPSERPEPDAIGGAGAASGDWVEVEGLQEVVRLLSSGERDAARQRLAQYLRDNPEDPRGWELSGVILMEQGKLEPARQSFQRAIVLDQGRVNALGNLAVVLLLEGETERAEAGLRQTLALDPDHHLALAYLGWLEQSRGRVERAIEAYERLVHDSDWQGAGRLTSIHLSLAGLYLRSGAFDEVVDLLEPGIDDAALDRLPGAGLLLGIAFIERGEPARARPVLERIRGRLARDNPVYALALGALAWAEGRPDEAMDQLADVAEEHPGHAVQAQVQRARIAAASGNADQAVDALHRALAAADRAAVPAVLHSGVELLVRHGRQEAGGRLVADQLERYPEDARLHHAAAQLQLRLERPAEALATAEALVRLQPDSARGHHFAGRIAEAAGEPARAEAHYRHAVDEEPAFIDSWTRLAALRTGAGEMEAATEVLERALTENPGNPVLHFELGTVLEARHRFDAANAHYRRVLQQAPDHLASLNNLAMNLLAEGGDKAEARELAARAHEIAPDDAVVSATYGRALLESGEVDRALELLENAVERAPRDGTLRYFLASAYEEKGRTERAQEEFRLADDLGYHVH